MATNSSQKKKNGTGNLWTMNLVQEKDAIAL